MRIKIKQKKEYLCVVNGCESRRADPDNWRCELHSVMYYGGGMLGIEKLGRGHRVEKRIGNEADNGGQDSRVW